MNAVQAPVQQVDAVTLPHPTEIVSAGATGYLTRAVYASGTEYRWTTYADGTTRYLTTPRTTFMGGRSDIVFSRKDGEDIYWVNDITRPDDGFRYGPFQPGPIFVRPAKVPSPLPRYSSGWGAYTHLVGMGDVDRDGRNDLFAYGKSGSFVYRGTGAAEAPFGPRESSSVYPALPTPRHPIV
ncbi:hypothetical protein J3A78_007613 [Streptomyces sp. PvR006]|uniref:hypothetical protein n=1 Tax=Streptomyces sp. PvR006 TaxID=2817860 RepID=UPI001AEA8FDA|nr:hypothetical protein [Streptomyces sp. PvR006]MBP2587135.1 hypothetical protein [Streptomyces sp. PvR006]